MNAAITSDVNTNPFVFLPTNGSCFASHIASCIGFDFVMVVFVEVLEVVEVAIVVVVVVVVDELLLIRLLLLPTTLLLTPPIMRAVAVRLS